MYHIGLAQSPCILNIMLSIADDAFDCDTTECYSDVSCDQRSDVSLMTGPGHSDGSARTGPDSEVEDQDADDESSDMEFEHHDPAIGAS